MDQIGISAFQIIFVLVSTWLGSRSSRLYRLTFLALLALGSVYIGWFGLNMLSPQMASNSPISASGRQLLMFAFCVTAVLSGLLLLPCTQHILARTTGRKLQSAEQMLGAWLFIVMILINVAFLLIASSSSLILIIAGAGQNTLLLNELLRDVSYLVIALLGAGIYIRRRPAAVLQRLGLDAGLSGKLAYAFSLLIVGGIIFATLFGAMLLQGSDSTALSSVHFTMNRTLPSLSGDLLQTLAVALFVGLLAGICQEILFRGLLQPTFGIFPTTLLFTVVHSQSGLSPVLLPVFVLGLACGCVRHNYGTWAAILVHVICTTALIIGWRLLALY